jgi:hypothetical protein
MTRDEARRIAANVAKLRPGQSRANPTEISICSSRRRLVFRGRRRHLSRHVYVQGNHGNAAERGVETRPPPNIAKLPELLKR